MYTGLRSSGGKSKRRTNFGIVSSELIFKAMIMNEIIRELRVGGEEEDPFTEP